MKVVYTKKKKKNQFSFYSHNKFLVPTLLTPLDNNHGAATGFGNIKNYKNK